MFCLISITFTLTYSLISKKILTRREDHDPVAYAFLLFMCVSIYSLVLYIVQGGGIVGLASLSEPQTLLVLAIDLVCYAVAPSLYYRSLKHLPLSEATILYTLTGMYTLIFGISLGYEPLYPVRILGAVVVLAAVMLVTRKEGRWKLNQYAWMLVGSTVLYGAAAVTDHIIITKVQVPTLLFQSINFGVPAVIMMLLNPRSISKISGIVSDRGMRMLVPLNGAFFMISFFSIFEAYRTGGAASQVNIVLATETVLTVLLSALVLKERKFLNIKILASVVASAGVYLLTLK